MSYRHHLQAVRPVNLLPDDDILEIVQPLPAYEDKITLNFSPYPEILKAVQTLAKTEFRDPDKQIFYMLKRQIDQG